IKVSCFGFGLGVRGLHSGGRADRVFASGIAHVLPSPQVPDNMDYALPMATRTRFLITTTVLCHLILTSRLVTSQLLPSPKPSNVSSLPASHPPRSAKISALRQEKDGSVYKLNGNVTIDYGTYRFSGDQATYNSDSGETTAEGHIL